MKKKIVAIQDFDGAVDERGISSTRYEKGKAYEVHPELADTFVAGRLAKHEEAPKQAPAKAPEAGKDQAAAPAKS